MVVGRLQSTGKGQRECAKTLRLKTLKLHDHEEVPSVDSETNLQPFRKIQLPHEAAISNEPFKVTDKVVRAKPSKPQLPPAAPSNPSTCGKRQTTEEHHQAKDVARENDPGRPSEGGSFCGVWPLLKEFGSVLVRIWIGFGTSGVEAWTAERFGIVHREKPRRGAFRTPCRLHGTTITIPNQPARVPRRTERPCWG